MNLFKKIFGLGAKPTPEKKDESTSPKKSPGKSVAKKVPDNVHQLPYEQRAKYADPSCVKLVNDTDALEQIIGQVDPKNTEFFSHWTKKSATNMIYFSLHAPEPYASKAKVLVEAYNQFIINQSPNT